MTVRKKLWGTAFLVLVAILAMALTTYFEGGAMMQGVLQESGLSVVDRSAGNMNSVMQGYSSTLAVAAEAIRHNYTSLGASDRAGIAKAAAAMLAVARSYGLKELFFGFESDGSFADGGGWEAPADFDSRGRDWYKRAVAAPGGAVICSEPYVIAATGLPGLTMAVAVRDDAGKLLGVVGADVDLEALSNYVTSLSIYRQGTGTLYLKSGLVVASQNRGDVLKRNDLTAGDSPQALRAALGRMVSGENGFANYTNASGQKMVVFYAPVYGDFYLGISLPTAVIDSRIRKLALLVLSIAAVLLLVLCVVFFGLARGITRSIRNIIVPVEGMGSGDLSVRCEVTGNDEFSQIARALNRTGEAIEGVIQRIRSEASASAAQSAELAASSDSMLESVHGVNSALKKVNSLLSEGTGELESVSSSIDEVASEAQSGAQAAAQGADQSSAVNDGANRASGKVAEALSGMKDAAQNSLRTMEQIQALAQSVDAISGFVSSITAIADQTNLLALNAAIEAARAGDAGRGFAVVAESVRKLAEESAKAADEVNRLIVTLQRHSSDSLSATKETGELLSGLLLTAESAAQELRDVQSATEGLNTSIHNVAEVSQQQAASSEEMTASVQNVTRAIEDVVSAHADLDASAQDILSGVERMDEAARSMADTSTHLQELVQQFTVSGV